MSKNPRPAVFFGFDPGRSGAVAVSLGKSITTQPMKCGQLPYEVHTWADTTAFAFIVIERSTSRTPMFRAHRANAKDLEGAMRGLFARRNKIIFVDPNKWQGDLGVCNPDTDRPGRVSYVAYSIQHLGGLPAHSQDEHAARCILHWAIKTGAWGG